MNHDLAICRLIGELSAIRAGLDQPAIRAAILNAERNHRRSSRRSRAKSRRTFRLDDLLDEPFVMPDQRADHLDELRHAFDRMSRRQVAIMSHLLFGCLTVREIAQRLQMSARTVSALIRHTRARIRPSAK